MRKLIILFARLFGRKAQRPSFDDMLIQVHRVRAYTCQARSQKVLDLIEGYAVQIAAHHAHHLQTAYHINRLHNLILIRRCELCAQQYSENEAA